VPVEQPPGRQAAIALLESGVLHVEGRLAEASNLTFLCTIGDGALSAGCVYKPVRGERPLDDFPPRTLANRERAAYLLSEAMGWRIVPPTVLRDGPLGPGMAQLWVDADPAADVLAMVLRPDERLRRICVFDVLANNADRKGTHLLPLPEGHVQGVDHGVCFAQAPKLRTVLWGWRGEALEQEELDVVRTVRDAVEGWLGAELRDLLSLAEIGAIGRRAEGLLRAGRFPLPDPDRPALPWPPF
jgi:hypothetical protein